jgi:hypothetical protein
MAMMLKATMLARMMFLCVTDCLSRADSGCIAANGLSRDCEPAMVPQE